MTKEALLIKQYYQIQKHRISFFNQINSLLEKKEDPSLFKDFYERLYSIEKDIYKAIKHSIKDKRIYKEFLKDVKGIGPVLASGLISTFDVRKAKHSSSFWKYAGLDVQDGKAPRLKRGKKTTFNPFARELCWKIGEAFIKTKSPYVQYYEEYKARDEKKNPHLTRIHRHNRAKRYMVKRFLIDFWIEWRTIEGLPVSKPYVISQLKHTEQPVISKAKK